MNKRSKQKWKTVKNVENPTLVPQVSHKMWVNKTKMWKTSVYLTNKCFFCKNFGWKDINKKYLKKIEVHTLFKGKQISYIWIFYHPE